MRGNAPSINKYSYKGIGVLKQPSFFCLFVSLFVRRMTSEVRFNFTKDLGPLKLSGPPSRRNRLFSCVFKTDVRPLLGSKVI